MTNAAALRADGKVVAAGYLTRTGVEQDFMLARFNADGSPDRTFGTEGHARLDTGSPIEMFNAVLVQPDGKLLVAGYVVQARTQLELTDTDFLLLRYNANGTLDTTFGAGGIATADFYRHSLDHASCVAVQPSGAILGGGDAHHGGMGPDFALVRYNGAAQPTYVQFGGATYSGAEQGGAALVAVTRTGDTTGTSAVDYTTVDDPAAVRCDDTTNNHGAAYARCDYATTMDTLTFAPGETSKQFAVPLIDDAHAEGAETVPLRLSNPQGATLGPQANATLTLPANDAGPAQPSPVNASPFFVRQQYLDFLSREPEPDGLAAWLRVLNNCPDVDDDPACDRVTVSSSFFGSPEFQLKGGFVFRFYRVSLARLPAYDEIVADMRRVTGQTAEEVYAKRDAFARAWLLRPEVERRFAALADAAYVDALLEPYRLNAVTTPDPLNPDGAQLVTLTRADLVSRLGAGALTRAQVMRAVVQSREVEAAEYDRAFVATQYYGYLRRTPEEGGYNSWLNYLNAHPSEFRTMVNGFVNSYEYRLRFGRP
ncbi:MAG TPA: Calx-beta domain-containing protein [Pyrinomonadaceae bacterium]